MAEAFGNDSLGLALLALAVLTGIINIAAGIINNFSVLLWAGAGFLGGAAIFALGDRLDSRMGLEHGFTRATIAGLSLPYTGYQLVAYYAYYRLSFGPLALIDKFIQGIFLILATTYLYKLVSKNSG
ncbi:MAG: hypothetical protein H8Z69_06030 [Nanohaloarchaea archaeon]|nr:hypothetical protein [Candidatus Nanohaloarchaea archaeon]